MSRLLLVVRSTTLVGSETINLFAAQMVCDGSSTERKRLAHRPVGNERLEYVASGDAAREAH